MSVVAAKASTCNRVPLLYRVIRVAERRQASDKFVGNEFAQPKAASGEEQGCPSLIPMRLLE
ncbi:hypothetical protein AIQ71_17980 [Salmonella enterica]|uniref:Uncharacterized protein n=7 Tax=Salmonella enterica TaxID=28901 RepID=A0A3Z4JGG2_SALER|nr:hypothetical protein DOE56_06050 [Salmonella enterica subsp. arizonae serovar 63:g,z51:-]EAA5369391.1 hypothetical protein [Salmonella enterica subsp. arizonae]EAA8278400.1 hypothetical protein [Salmonella enterica]EAN8390589.1 hypothetical protein [Salmonella enterica subsp. arizonae serovar 13,23:gz51:-]EAN8611340.1 hypothetical protein [Salmonella enterica subsp. arizonae serovar 48:z4,z24:-]EAO5936314.1 hypothetical protein [Salmonella enterica subsp. houtenae serovar 48:g,z51:-]EAO600